ncbi:MAG TPA: TolC family protein [Gammaproteobacteria bacterium]|nr:TolC family protein [Gammaproteobacteria bacterium]
MKAAALAGLTLMTCTAAAEPLTLEEAISRALDHDPRIDEVVHLAEAARSWVDEARASGDLRVDLNTFVGLSPAVGGGLFEAGSCEAGSCRLRSDRYENHGASVWLRFQLALIKPLYTFGKIEHYAQAAEANLAVKQEDIRLRRSRTALDVQRAYYGYLAARDTRLLFTDVQKRLDAARDLTREWLDQGEGGVRQSDLYALDAGAALVRRYLFQAEGLEHVALASLKVLTGAAQDQPLEVADSRLRPVPLPQQGLAELKQRALQQRPEMAQVAAGLTARRELVAAKKADARPSLYAGVAGLVSYSPNRDKVDNPHITDPFNDYGATPMVGLQWQWGHGVQAARVARAEAELNAMIAKAALARQGIPYQVAEAYHQAAAGRQAVAAMEDASRSARRWMIASFVDFEAGLEEASKVVTAFQGYVLAHSDYLKTVYDYNMQVAQLKRAIGADPLGEQR